MPFKDAVVAEWLREQVLAMRESATKYQEYAKEKMATLGIPEGYGRVTIGTTIALDIDGETVEIELREKHPSDGEGWSQVYREDNIQ